MIYEIDALKIPYFRCFEFEKITQNKESLLSSFFNDIKSDLTTTKVDLSKIGFFFYDSLYDIDSLRELFFLKEQDTLGLKRDWETSNRSDSKISTNFEWLKKYSEHRSFCQT